MKTATSFSFTDIPCPKPFPCSAPSMGNRLFWTAVLELRASELAMILDGIDVSKLKRLPRYVRGAG